MKGELVPASELINYAEERNTAIASLNFNNYEFLNAICKAAAELEVPVILATSEGAIKYMGIDVISAMVPQVVKRYGIKASLHLDHGRSFETVMLAIRYGYTSVMIDASDKPYEENVRITSEVVRACKPLGITVEAELGVLAGVEDEISAERGIYTDPQQAKDFVEKTGVDMLAVAVGTSHGAYKFKGEPHIDIDRVKKIRELTKKPLVLHGASGVYGEFVEELGLEGAKGLSDDLLIKAIKSGIRKVNTDTDLRMAFMLGLKRSLNKNPKEIDPRKHLIPAMEEVYKMALRRLMVITKS
ncbi:MAG: class II fructose-bisphosphate aldolase [candidate division WOR-3 bacterium]